MPNVTGTDREAGIKTDLFNHRVNVNFAFFDQKVTNEPQLAGIDASTGRGYWNALGENESKGADADVALTLYPGWQLLASWMQLHNVTPPQDYIHIQTWSVFTKYELPSSTPLSGLSVGAGLIRQRGLYVSLFSWAGAETPAEKATGYIEAKPGMPLKLFASYRLDRHWTFRLSCDNVTDQHYAVAAGFAAAVDVSEPRLFTLEADFKF